MRHILITAIALSFMMFSNAFAHDVWMEKRNGDIGVLYGHGLKLDPYDPEKIKDVKGFDSKGKAVKVEIVKRKESALISPKGEAATIGMLFDGGYGVKTTEGSKKLTKREAKGNFEIIESTRSYKYSKAMVGPSDVSSKPIGLRLEIVPQKNPFAIKIGETLPIKVLFEGKPLEGATIKAGCTHERNLKEYSATDKDGVANVVIEKGCNQIINASYKTALKDDPDADLLSISTNMTFEVK
ncbi:MAG: DUF4198 domain-containing protein [Syntrophales bacterium]|nr:DUF4198 domain-containing protein [Syntrophales bacterium]